MLLIVLLPEAWELRLVDAKAAEDVPEADEVALVV